MNHGIVAFYDTAVIDGCREFIADLRIYNNGSYDVRDSHGTNSRNCGITNYPIWIWKCKNR